jgi:glycosyltransferase involved in cell wall biosynthesis
MNKELNGVENPVTICHISTDLDIGGAEMMLLRLVDQQIADNKQVVVISLLGLGKVGEQLRQLGVTVYTIDMQGKLAFPLALWRLVRLLQKVKPDIVQTWMYHADLLGGIAAYWCGIRQIIWGIHCTRLPLGRPLTRLVMQASAWLSGKIPAKIVCVADAAKHNHIGYGYVAAKMQVIPNGFTVPTLVKSSVPSRPLLSALGVAADQFVVGCVGRFHPDKGQDLLIEAAALVIARQPHLRFVLAGRGCDANNLALTEQISRYGLTEQVLLLGERDDIPALLPEFDLFCMPSRSEAFPVALGEAMLAGIPCVATRVGDSEVLGGPDTVFVDALDVSALANAILERSQLQPEFLLSLGMKGRQRVLDRFSIQSVSRQYEAIYQDLLSH